MYRKVKEFRKTASVLEVNKILKPYVVTKVRYQKYSTHGSTKLFKSMPTCNYRSTKNISQ